MPSKYSFVQQEVLRSSFPLDIPFSLSQLTFLIFRFLIEVFVPAFFIGFSYCYLTEKKWSKGMQIFVVGSLAQFGMIVASYHGFVSVYNAQELRIVARIFPRVVLLCPFFSFLLGTIVAERKSGIEKHKNTLFVIIFSLFIFHIVLYIFYAILLSFMNVVTTYRLDFMFTLEEYLPYLFMGLFLGYFLELKSLIAVSLVVAVFNFVTKDIQFAREIVHATVSDSRVVFYPLNKFLLHVLCSVGAGTSAEYIILRFKNMRRWVKILLIFLLLYVLLMEMLAKSNNRYGFLIY